MGETLDLADEHFDALSDSFKWEIYNILAEMYFGFNSVVMFWK